MTDTDEFPAAWWPRPTIRTSRDFGELAKALAAAQSEMRHPLKKQENPHFRSRYADLAEVIDATDTLNRHEIAVMFSAPAEQADSVRIVIMFAHSSNQWQEGTLDVPLPAVTAQGLGSACTYGRRYLLSGMCNVASDDDDDGNEASKPPPIGQRQAAPRNEKPSPLVENRPIMGAIVAAMRAEAKELKLADTDLVGCVRLASGGRTDDLKLLWRDEVDKLRDAMANRKKTMQPTLEDA